MGQVIKARKDGLSVSNVAGADMLSILLTDPMFKDNE
jgi:hypothetical protein